MCKIWTNSDKADYYTEYYADEKLEYLCFKAMLALNYLHTQNVYYGDMKPQNLLVFKNYNVKIGDFGTAMKLQTDPDALYYVKGYTKRYATSKIQQAFEL